MLKDKISGKRKAYVSLMRILTGASAALTCFLVLFLVGYVMMKGIPNISWELLSTAPSYLSDRVGILPDILNTVYIVIAALLVALPLGVGAAIYLTEYAGSKKLVAAIEYAAETLSGIPSIIYGLVGMLFFCQFLNMQTSLLAGALICWCIDWALRKKTPAAFLLTGAAVAAAFCLLELAVTDYRGWGMLLVVLFYGVRRVSCGTVVKRTAQAVGLAVFSIGIMGGVSIELWSLAALLPLWLYNGRRGYSNRAVQYGFYAFYPVHILILSLIALYA